MCLFTDRSLADACPGGCVEPDVYTVLVGINRVHLLVLYSFESLVATTTSATVAEDASLRSWLGKRCGAGERCLDLRSRKRRRRIHVPPNSAPRK